MIDIESWEKRLTIESLEMAFYEKPSKRSIQKAKDVLIWTNENNLCVESVDYDVLGGVSIYLKGSGLNTVWISLMNSGNDSVVFTNEEGATGHKFNDGELETIKKFLAAPTIEGALVNGTTENGDWEPLVSISITEYERLRDLADDVRAIADDLSNSLSMRLASHNPRGMQVPYHGPFASATPSTIKDLNRLLESLRTVLGDTE